MKKIKIRTGYVANSSSCSYIFAFEHPLTEEYFGKVFRKIINYIEREQLPEFKELKDASTQEWLAKQFWRKLKEGMDEQNNQMDELDRKYFERKGLYPYYLELANHQTLYYKFIESFQPEQLHYFKYKYLGFDY